MKILKNYYTTMQIQFMSWQKCLKWIQRGRNGKFLNITLIAYYNTGMGICNKSPSNSTSNIDQTNEFS